MTWLHTTRARLLDLEKERKRASTLTAKLKALQDAVQESREETLTTLFAQIAAKVFDYYERLHDSEREISSVELKPDSRAINGGLGVLISFFESSPSEPMLFLSEGHADSLGICLWMATAKLYGRCEQLLVLDDVLTSIDSGHRRAVAELLIEEFDDRQIIITTHDEYWFGVLESLVTNVSTQKWRHFRFDRWSISSGPILAEEPDLLTKAEQVLASHGVLATGGFLRVHTERFVKWAAEALRLQVDYRSRELNLGEFFNFGLVGKLMVQLQARVNDSAEADKMKRALALSLGLSAVTNLLVHDKDVPSLPTAKEIQDYIDNLRIVESMSRTSLRLKL
jgi:hypothetical protein